MALNEYEHSMFAELLEADGFHLLEAELDGVTVGVVCVEADPEEDDDDAMEDTVATIPVAILLSEAMFERLSPPRAAVVSDTDVPGVSSSDPPE